MTGQIADHFAQRKIVATDEFLEGTGTPHRPAERGDRGFGLLHQAICSVRCLLDELPGGVVRVPRPPTHLLGHHRATVKMAAHAFGQIRTTARAEVRAVTKELGG